ncbi:unnamed protein product [Dovyalis caffra]|uniref:14-3-3 domain-containing protein n=1 Tax=Dovyalis caffra TaxID=77055 RepID=A0AAV1R5I6_9ROSI|nr:unnamed protein product [Dovyalis caffra]
MAERQKIVYHAKLAEQDELYADVVDSMKKAAKLDPNFTAEERDLLSIGCKNMIAEKRKSWRVLSSMEQKDEEKGNGANVKRMAESRRKLESEITNFCNDIVTLIDEYLLPFASGFESSVFYYKMKGDFYRYVAEIKIGDEEKEAADHSMEAYETGFKVAKANLAPTNLVRLNLALNFAVFYYAILNLPERACCLAQQACDEAKPGLERSNEQSCKHSISTLKLLESNIKLWTS